VGQLGLREGRGSADTVSVPDDSDEALARAAAAGAPAAFGVLVERYQERVYRLMWRLMRDRHDAEDALQDAFLQVQAKIAQFRGEALFSTWLYRVATNTALSALRRRKRRAAEPLDDHLPRFEAGGLHQSDEVRRVTAVSVEERLDRERLADEALRALERLPEDYRTAFVLRDLQELSTSEAAAALGIGEDLLRQRLHRARLMLRGFLAALAGGRA
jgi:RNA polymerase sigma-70 factor, ECF subfamily